jgi:osmotically-inducible protein OsmY
MRRSAAGRRRGPSWLGAAALAAGSATIGAAVAFLADPARGRSRRARLIDQSAASLRHARRGIERALRGVTSTAGGKLEAVMEGGSRVAPTDDVTLRDRAESILFRDPAIPKGTINLNVERGVLVLRGEVPDDDLRERLAREAARIDGVWSVRNLLHLPGEAIPEERIAATS